jgi:hypothetical protein
VPDFGQGRGLGKANRPAVGQENRASTSPRQTRKGAPRNLNSGSSVCEKSLAHGLEKPVRHRCDGFYAGDVAKVENCCHDAFTTLTYAPVEIFPDLGLKKGKAWIKESIRIQQERYSSRCYKLSFVMVDGLRAACLSDVSVTKRNDQRIPHFVAADLFTLSSGRVIEHRAFFDSFNLLEQLLGQDLTGPFTDSLKKVFAQMPHSPMSSLGSTRRGSSML